MYTTECYMEIEGYDTRIAITKMKSFIETFSHANIALTYTNKDEYGNSDDTNTSFLRKTHFLLQIPWFYYSGILLIPVEIKIKKDV